MRLSSLLQMEPVRYTVSFVERYSEPRRAQTKLVYSVWQSAAVRANAPCPGRKTLDLQQLRSAISNVFLLDAVDAGCDDFRVRLFGTGLVRLVGRDMTGMLLSDIDVDDFRMQMYRDVARGSKPEALLVDMKEEGGAVRRLEFVACPMCNEQTGLPLILAAYSLVEMRQR